MKTECLEKLKPNFTSVLYNTNVNVIGKHLSGLLVFKKMPDSSIRVIFSAEAGIKFFDFGYSKNGFKVYYCMNQLNRKIVLKQLQTDIGLLIFDRIVVPNAKTMNYQKENYFLFHTAKDDTYYVTDEGCTKLLRIETSSKRKKKIVVNLSGFKAGMADSVNIDHKTFDFNISLKQLDR